MTPNQTKQTWCKWRRHGMNAEFASHLYLIAFHLDHRSVHVSPAGAPLQGCPSSRLASHSQRGLLARLLWTKVERRPENCHFLQIVESGLTKGACSKTKLPQCIIARYLFTRLCWIRKGDWRLLVFSINARSIETLHSVDLLSSYILIIVLDRRRSDHDQQLQGQRSQAGT